MYWYEVERCSFCASSTSWCSQVLGEIEFLKAGLLGDAHLLRKCTGRRPARGLDQVQNLQQLQENLDKDAKLVGLNWGSDLIGGWQRSLKLQNLVLGCTHGLLVQVHSGPGSGRGLRRPDQRHPGQRHPGLRHPGLWHEAGARGWVCSVLNRHVW